MQKEINSKQINNNRQTGQLHYQTLLDNVVGGQCNYFSLWDINPLFAQTKHIGKLP